MRHIDTGSSPPADHPVTAENLTRRFGERTAVDGLNLQIAAGEIFGLLGPNGAGKTTTIRMLTTLLRPTSGTARIAGHDVVTDRRAVRRAIGTALQGTAVDPLMTGAEMMRLQAALYAIAPRPARVRAAELLERFGLAAVAGDRISTYSGGMRRRLDLALALLHRPRVLFLDEPTTGVDPPSRAAVWQEVRALSRDEGTTVLLTTQYLEEADQLCSRVAIIDHGRIVRLGRVSELKREVDLPVLVLAVPEAQMALGTLVLEPFGAARRAPDGMLAVGLAGGDAAIADVVRALDGHGVRILQLRLQAPSLDDVYTAATAPPAESTGPPAPPPSPSTIDSTPAQEPV